MRLTYKTDNGEYTGMSNKIPIRQALEKLSKFEDIEDAFAECGVDIFEHLNNSLKVVKKYKSAIPFWLIPPTYFDEIMEKYRALYNSKPTTHLEDKQKWKKK